LNWYNKPKYNVKKQQKIDTNKNKSNWQKCPKCEKIIYAKDLKENFYVCEHCNYHFKISTSQRIELLIDKNTFKETNKNISSGDPLKFSDAKEKYPDKVKRSINKLKTNEAVTTGTGKINKINVSLAVMNFSFLGGSMGSAVGEKIYRSIKLSISKKIPLVIVSCSGGARMHEGILSLMQMAKTSAALAQLEEKKIPFISVLTDPTTGGVTASFASLGDIIVAEPEALIGFAGPRVIEQNINQKLPKGFQRSEFLLEHGFIDLIVNRNDLKMTLYKLLNFF